MSEDRRDSIRSERPRELELRAWMVAYQEGRIEGFDHLFGALQPALRRYLTVLGGDYGRAEDLVQETFMQIHRARHSYDPAQPLLPWAFAIARHVFLMEQRRLRRRPQATVAIDRAAEALLPVPAEAERLGDRLRVSAAVARVSSDRREAMLLHHVWGFSFREIAALLGITEAAAKLRSSRGMADLRASLEMTGGNERP